LTENEAELNQNQLLTFCGLLWRRWWTCRFHKWQGISWL